MGIKSRATFAVLSYAAAAAAHGHVTGAVINGVYYRGFLPDSDPYQASPPTVIGWSTTATDNGFVAPDAYTSADIICHKGAKPAGGHAAVKAGDSVAITWNTWPDSHHGPVIDMLAKCPGDCETVDKTALEFFKIDGPGLVSGANPGTWASDVLLKNNLTWMVQIPSTLAPGNYVLRHEIIALHSAGQPNGAQNYPQCLSLAVTGSGTDTPAGVKGEALYKATDPGIAFNIYTSPLDYTVPGPKLLAGASVSVAQSVSAVTATGTATAPGGGSGGGGGGGGAVPTTTGGSGSGGSGGGAATTTGKAGGSGGASNTGGGVSPTSAPTSARGTAPPNTLVTSTRRAASTLAASTRVATTQAPGGGNGGGAGAGGQTLYGQCGGSNWNGPTACAAGSCTMLNPYYYQCLNGN